MFIMFRFEFEGEEHKRRRDDEEDWMVGEKVHIVNHPSSGYEGKSKKQIMGDAEVVGKSAVWVGSTPLSKYNGEESITNLGRTDAVANGFGGVTKMRRWVKKRYRGLADKNPMYKLTLKKIGKD